MMSEAGLATLLVAALASFFMAWSIGAGSSGSTPFAPAVGANAISIMRAAFYVGLLGLAGAAIQGANVSETVGGGLILGVELTPVAVITVLVVAATLVAMGVFAGYPIATAFAVTGAVIGVGLALGGAPAWSTYGTIAALWLAVPVVGGGAAYATTRILRSVDRDQVTVPLLAGIVGMVVANIRFDPFGPPGVQRSMADLTVAAIAGAPEIVRMSTTVAIGLAISVLVYSDVHRDPEGGQRRFLLALGGLVAFSAGGSQVGLAVGPLLPLLADRVPLTSILVGGGIGLLLGSWTGAPRMIKAVSKDYSSLGPRRSIAALIPAFVLAQAAVFLGVPVSFNEIVVSAIVGSGYAVGQAGVSARKMGYTVLAWIGSLVVSFGLGYVGFLAVGRLL